MFYSLLLREFARRVKPLGITRECGEFFEVQPFDLLRKRIWFFAKEAHNYTEELDELELPLHYLKDMDSLMYKVREFASTLWIPYVEIVEGCTPVKFRDSDSGFDLVSRINCEIESKSYALVPCGIILALPPFLEGQIRGRSSFAVRGILTHFGTIDSGYRGELGPILFNMSNETLRISRGDRVCQLVIVPKTHLPPIIRKFELMAVPHFKETDRGDKGFGSTGLRL